MSSSSTNTKLKALSLYRAFLRELPIQPISPLPSIPQPRTHAQKTPTLLSHRSPMHQRLRTSFAAPSPAPSSPEAGLRQAEQVLIYVRAQRTYATLLERYNPGLVGDMDDEERVRLTARRVGMEMPVDYVVGAEDGKGGDGKE